MRTVEDYNNYLLSNGYKLSDLPFSFTDGELVAITYENEKTGKVVELFCQYQEDLMDELIGNAIDGEDVWTEDNRKRMEVTSVFVQTNIVNVCDFITGEKNGIILVSNENPLNHHETGKWFEKAIWIQNNETEHAVKIMKSHLMNICFFNREIRPLIEPYYMNMYDSMIDILEKETSDPFFTWGMIDYQGDYEICFTTDCITGELNVEIPYGTYDEYTPAVFRDVYYNFNRDEFLEAMNLSRARAQKIERSKER